MDGDNLCRYLPKETNFEDTCLANGGHLYSLTGGSPSWYFQRNVERRLVRLVYKTAGSYKVLWEVLFVPFPQVLTSVDAQLFLLSFAQCWGFNTRSQVITCRSVSPAPLVSSPPAPLVKMCSISHKLCMSSHTLHLRHVAYSGFLARWKCCSIVVWSVYNDWHRFFFH